MRNNLPHATVATIVEDDGRYLLVKESRNGKTVYNQPAGHIENGEGIIEAAIRETQEETGWIVMPTRVAGLCTYHAPSGTSYVRTTLIAEPIEQIVGAELDSGIIAAEWMTYEEILLIEDQLRSPVVKRVIENYRLGISYPLELICAQR